MWSYWSHQGDFTGTPAVADGKVFAGSNGGWVYALDAVTGKPVWAHNLGEKAPVDGSVAVDGGKVLVPVAEVGHPRVVALDAKSGKPLWDTVIDTQKDADVYGSPSVWNGMVYIGQSAEYGETSDPAVNTRGSVAALDERTGRIRWKTYTVPPGRDGGAVWTTPAIDGPTGRLYVGTGNAYHPPAADTTDSVLAIDARSGHVLGHYQATPDDDWNGTQNEAGVDYDFGSSPNLFTGPDGRKLVGIGQKAGDYWALDRMTLQPVWHTKTTIGSPVVGGIVGSTATDGKRIYGPDTIGGESWALDTAGHINWVSADGGPLHFNPTTVANGVVYTTDMSGYLTARDAASGLPLLKIPLGTPSWGGVAVAGGWIFADTGSQGSAGYSGVGCSPPATKGWRKACMIVSMFAMNPNGSIIPSIRDMSAIMLSGPGTVDRLGIPGTPPAMPGIPGAPSTAGTRSAPSTAAPRASTVLAVTTGTPGTSTRASTGARRSPSTRARTRRWATT